MRREISENSLHISSPEVSQSTSGSTFHLGELQRARQHQVQTRICSKLQGLDHVRPQVPFYHQSAMKASVNKIQTPWHGINALSGLTPAYLSVIVLCHNATLLLVCRGTPVCFKSLVSQGPSGAPLSEWLLFFFCPHLFLSLPIHLLNYFFWRLPGRIFSMPFSQLLVWREVLDIPWLVDTSTWFLPPSSHGHLFVCLYLSFPFLRGHWSCWMTAHPRWVWPHLNLIISTEMLFPNNVTFTGTGGLGLDISFWGTPFNLHSTLPPFLPLPLSPRVCCSLFALSLHLYLHNSANHLGGKGSLAALFSLPILQVSMGSFLSIFHFLCSRRLVCSILGLWMSIILCSLSLDWIQLPGIFSIDKPECQTETISQRRLWLKGGSGCNVLDKKGWG